MISQRLLYLSLSANLLLAGIIGGMVLSRFPSSGTATVSQEHAVNERPADFNPVRSVSQNRPAQAEPVRQTPASIKSPASPSAPSNSSAAGSWQYAQSSSPATRSSSPAVSSRPSNGSSTAQAQLPASYSNDIGSSVSSGASIPASYGNAAISSSGQAVSGGGASVNPVALEAIAPTGPARTITGPVTPDGSGNSFTDRGQKVAVADAPAAADGSTSEDLNVIVTPDPNSTATDSSSSGGRPVAFTRDQDLFRAKWGWGAYGEAQRVAWDVTLGHATN